MGKHNAPPPPPTGPGPYPSAEESQAKADAFDAQWEANQNDGKSPPMPPTPDMRGGNFKL